MTTKKAAVKKAAAVPAKKATASKAAPVTAKRATPAPAKKAAPAPAKKAAPARKATATATARKATTTPSPATPASKAAPAKKAATPAAPVSTFTGPGPYAADPNFLAEQRMLLINEREVYQGQAEELRAEADSLALEREPGDVQFDEESGEGGTVAVDRERDLALSGQALLAVEEIDEALRRIDRKTYGACERCHEAIPKARLRALLYARLCVACKSGGLSRR